MPFPGEIHLSPDRSGEFTDQPHGVIDITPRHVALRVMMISLGGLACLEVVSYRVRDPFLWDREIRLVPLAFALAPDPVGVMPLDRGPAPLGGVYEVAPAATALTPLGRIWIGLG